MSSSFHRRTVHSILVTLLKEAKPAQNVPRRLKGPQQMHSVKVLYSHLLSNKVAQRSRVHVFWRLEAATHALILSKMRKTIDAIAGKYHIGLTGLACSCDDAVTAVAPEVQLVDNLPWCTRSTGALSTELFLEHISYERSYKYISNMCSWNCG